MGELVGLDESGGADAVDGDGRPRGRSGPRRGRRASSARGASTPRRGPGRGRALGARSPRRRRRSCFALGRAGVRIRGGPRRPRPCCRMPRGADRGSWCREAEPGADASRGRVIAGGIDPGAEALAGHLRAADRAALREHAADAQPPARRGGLVALAQHLGEQDRVGVDRCRGDRDFAAVDRRLPPTAPTAPARVTERPLTAGFRSVVPHGPYRSRVPTSTTA